MRVISKNECAEWLKSSLGIAGTVDEIEHEYPNGATYLLPSDTGKKTALGRALVGLLQVESPGLFWITATGIWPSSENMSLFDGYRRSFGENRTLDAAPPHVFSDTDLTELECLLDMALYFYWDSILLERPEGVAVKTSHDEYISVHAKDRDRLSRIKRNLDDLGLKPLDRS